MNRFVSAAIVVLGLLTGCYITIPDLDGDTETDFECVGVCIGDAKVSLPDGRLHDGPLPDATSFGDEPVIGQQKWVPVGTGVAALEIEVEFPVSDTAPVSFVLGDFYVEIEGKVYVVTPVEVAGDSVADAIDACNVLAQQQGYTCTERCVEACSCVDCGDPTMATNIINSCAVNCSIYSHQGQIGPEPYTSEEVMADYLYNGSAELGVTGMLQSLPDCSGQVCRDRAAAQVSKQKSKRTQIRFNFGDNSHLANLNVGNLVATADPVNDTPIQSEQAGAARVSNRQGCISYSSF